MHVEAAFLGAIVGWLRGGKIKRLTGLTLPGWFLAVMALALQLAIKAGFIYRWDYSGIAAPYLHVFSYALLLWFVYLNRRRRGMILMGLGLLLNFIVILANKGAMPVNLTGLAPHFQEKLYSSSGGVHTALTDQTVFPLLGDQIKIRCGFNRIISIGDILLALGIGVLIQHFMVLDPSEKK